MGLWGTTTQAVWQYPAAFSGMVMVEQNRLEDARRTLEQAGFRVKVRAVGIGNVLAQSPGGGARRVQGTTVTIYGL